MSVGINTAFVYLIIVCQTDKACMFQISFFFMTAMAHGIRPSAS